MIIGTALDIAFVFILIAVGVLTYRRSIKKMAIIKINSEGIKGSPNPDDDILGIPALKKAYLKARQEYLSFLAEAEAEEEKRNKEVPVRELTQEEKDAIKQKKEDSIKVVREVAWAYKGRLVEQAEAYKGLILPIMPLFSIVLTLFGIMLSRYTFGPVFWLFFSVATIVPLVYIALSVRSVPKAHMAGKYFLENFYVQVGPGMTIVWLGLDTIIVMATSTIYFKSEVDKIMLSGDESQIIELDVAVAYRPEDIFFLVENIGTTLGEIMEFMSKLLVTEIASISRYVITEAFLTADDALKMGRQIASKIDDRIESDYAKFLGVDIDPSQIQVNLSEEISDARTGRAKSFIDVVTSQNVRKQDFEKLMTNIDVLKQYKIDFGEDKRTLGLISLLLLGKEGIAAFEGKLNFNMVQGMEGLMNGLAGIEGNAVNPDNTKKLLAKINGMNPDKMEELLKGVDMLTGGVK